MLNQLGAPRFLVENHICETETISLASLWNISGEHAKHCVVANKKSCFIPIVNKVICDVCQKSSAEFTSYIMRCRVNLSNRAKIEASFWKNEIIMISSYSREQAIQELIKAKKIYEKIDQIEKYIVGTKL